MILGGIESHVVCGKKLYGDGEGVGGAGGALCELRGGLCLFDGTEYLGTWLVAVFFEQQRRGEAGGGVGEETFGGGDGGAGCGGVSGVRVVSAGDDQAGAEEDLEVFCGVGGVVCAGLFCGVS